MNNIHFDSSAIALIVAIVAPVFTAWITMRHQRKMYDLKRENDRLDRKYEAITSALSAVGICMANPSPDNLTVFGEKFHEAYAYVSPEHWDMLNHFFSHVVSGKTDDLLRMYDSVVKLLGSNYELETKSTKRGIWFPRS